MDNIQASTIDIKGIDHSSKKNIMGGKCIFPFVYKDKEYMKCVDGPRGSWCATKVDKSNKPIKLGFCNPKKELNTKGTVKNPRVSLHPSVSSKKVLNTKSTSKSHKISSRPSVVSKKKGLVIKKKVIISSKKKPDIKHHIPKKNTQLNPDYWILSNKKNFSNWIDTKFDNYRIKSEPKKLECAEVSKCKKMDLFSHQKIVRDFLQINSPHRGILLYHGLGVGKTCASIAVAEGLKHNRKIYILLNKSLKQNFKLELMKCGDEYYRLTNHWIFINANIGDPYFKILLDFGIPKSLILKNKGGWLIYFNKPPNFQNLSTRENENLKEQIELMIDSKYEFIHMNGLTSKVLKHMRETKKFNNSLLIIDEVHNLTNGMAKDKPGVRAGYLDTIIMEAENLKLIFLSGTPMINNLFESGKLFNLLRGYIIVFNFIIKPKQTPNWKQLEGLKEHPLIDYFFINKGNNIIKITRNPYGFIRNSNKTHGGVISDTENGNINKINNEQFIKILQTHFKSDYNLNVDYTIEKHTALPNDQDSFMRLFYDEGSENIKNINLFKRRIVGLVSHYKTFKKDLMPEVTREEVIEIPMSDYQFLQYSAVRHDEIEQDKSSKKKGKTATKVKSDAGTPSPRKGKKENILTQKSSYRAYSRMRCSFVFPENIERPRPGVGGSELKQIESEQEQDIDDVVNSIEDADIVNKDKEYEVAKAECLHKLNDTKYEYLIQGDSERLLKYSPKYDVIINKIKSVHGSSFIYTEYRTLEGIAVFSIVLKANGFSEFRLEQNHLGEWHIRPTLPEDIGKPKFAFWSGDEESGLMLKIFNNDWDSLPTTLKTDVESLDINNIRGDIIKTILTTKKGAEGISLHNVRQVHIIEPYWNPVRLEQVKGRAIRTGSHLNLPEKDRNVELYIYLSVMTPDQLKSDKTLQDDSAGKTSDQVLFDISQKKLKIMQTLLNAIKEVSIDCSLNILETQDSTLPFKCINSSSSDPHEYSYKPNIYDERDDSAQKRAEKTISWLGTVVNIPKYGKVVIREHDDGNKYVYNYDRVQSGRAGDPIGQVVMGKLKIFK